MSELEGTTEHIDRRYTRLKALAIEIESEEVLNARRLTTYEAHDLRSLLEELHRLHLAVSKQREMLEARDRGKKPAPRKR